MTDTDPDSDSNSNPDPDPSPECERDSTPDLPSEAVEEAERLTRLARGAIDPDERAACRERRAELVAEHGYATRVREEDAREILVLYPTEWFEDGTIRTDRIDDIDRAVERPLSGPGDPTDWDALDAHNRAVADRVADRHGPTHGANAQTFADFMGNHYARPIESAGDPEVSEFLTEYFPRNAWPSDEQRAVVETSIDLVFDAADADTADTGNASDATDTDADRC